MASDMSTYLGNAVCLWLAGTDMPTAPADCYVGLFNGNPKTSGTEVTTTIRPAGRIAITFDSITAGTDNELTNDADVDYGDSAGDVPTLSFAGVFDAATSGNLLFSKALPGGPFAVTTGTSVKFAAGDLTFTIGSAT
jgi:hypothetical protein